MQNSSHKAGDSGRSLGELLSDLTRDLSSLMRQEVQLAKTEMTENATRVAKNAGLLVGAGALAFFALQALVIAAILALIYVVPSPWMAALIVAVALLVIAGILAMVGLSALKKASLMPKQTVETIQEDVQWAKQQI